MPDDNTPLADILIRLAGPDDMVWIARTHGALYRRDEGFDDSFEPLVTTVLQGFMADHDPKNECGWVVEFAGEPAGSLFCTRLTTDTAKLRLFLLIPALRGRGLGHRLLNVALTFARDAGYQTMQVSTYERHVAACQLYRRAGFTLVSSKPARVFGLDMVEQTWEFTL